MSVSDFIDHILRTLGADDAMRCVNNVSFVLRSADESVHAVVTARTVSAVVQQALALNGRSGVSDWLLDDVMLFYVFFAKQAGILQREND